MPAVTLHRGDCLDVLDRLPADHFDAVITDPPYHLTSIVRRFSGGTPAGEGTDGLFRRGSRGFLGQSWDGGDIAFRPETWAKVLRVLKPGGHLAAFHHSRLYPHMVLAIEAAGFECRDGLLDLYDTGPQWAALIESLSPAQLRTLDRALAASPGGLMAWLYGTGFPHSHNIEKAIDKLRDDGAEIRQVTAWIAAARQAAGVTLAQIDAAFGFNGMAGHWCASGRQAAVPTLAQWPRLLALLSADPPADIAALVERLNARKGEPGEDWHNREVLGRVTEGAIAVSNWRENGGGGYGQEYDLTAAGSERSAEWSGWGTALKPAFEPIVLARKPLAESSVARQCLATGTGGLNIDAARVPSDRRDVFPARASTGPPSLGDFGPTERRVVSDGLWPATITHDGSREVVKHFPLDAGGASTARFFYCGKADEADRQGSTHPTVKPQALMRWLVRLLTRPGAQILDPFGGSGSTGWAAHAEGRNCDLIEMTQEYQAHIAARIAGLEAPPPPAAPAGQLDMFGGL